MLREYAGLTVGAESCGLLFDATSLPDDPSFHMLGVVLRLAIREYAGLSLGPLGLRFHIRRPLYFIYWTLLHFICKRFERKAGLSGHRSAWNADLALLAFHMQSVPLYHI